MNLFSFNQEYGNQKKKFFYSKLDDEVVMFLNGINLKKLIKLFKLNNVKMTDLLNYTDNDLKSVSD